MKTNKNMVFALVGAMVTAAAVAAESNVRLVRAGEGFSTNEAAEVRAFVAQGGVFAVTGIGSQEQLAPFASVLTNDIELVFVPNGDKPKKVRLETRSTLFSWPRYAKECEEVLGGIDVRGQNARFVEEPVWSHGRRVCRLYRLGKGFVFLAAANLDERFRGNLEKAGDLLRVGLEYRGSSFSFGHDSAPLPVFGEGWFNVSFYNCLETSVSVEARLDITTPEGASRRYWGLGGRERRCDFGVRIGGVYDLHGKCTGRLSVINRQTKEVAEIWTREIDFPGYLEIEPPFYRESVSTARRESDVRLALKANVFAEPLAGRSAEVTLVSPYGEELARTNVTFTGADRVEFRMPLAMTAPAGDYTVRATMPRAQGEGVARAERVFHVVAVEKNQVFVDQDGTILKGGVPWFPIGFYHVWPAEIEDVATTGADFIQFWDSHSTLGPGGTLDRIAKCGMKIVVEDGIWGMVVNTQPNPPEFYPFETDPAFRAREEALRDDPSGAIAFWYVADEPGRDCLPGMKRSNRHRREMDPQHPTFVCSTGDPAVGAEGDVLGLDVYPRYNNCVNPLTNVADAFDRARRYTRNRQSLFLAGQAFGNKKMHGETPEDVRAMAYLGLTHGARGIIWYTWHDGGYQGVMYYTETRKTVTAVISEIRAISPALFAPTGRVEARSRDGNVHALLCGDDQSGRYLVLVNGSDEAVKTELAMEALKGASLEPLFGAPSAGVSGGVVGLDFAGKATAVYKVSR